MADDKFYDGQPCKNCGETKKFKSSRACVRCHYEQKKAKQKPPDFRLSLEGRRLQTALAEKLGVPTTAVLELAIRYFARQEQLE